MAKTWQAVLLAALAATARSLSVDTAGATDRREVTAVKACETCATKFLSGLCYVAPCADGTGEFCWSTSSAAGYALCSAHS
mmetsp:Transcript_48348/g.125398  ORF Transcript_48348/g.125398 Transcript_48348/m.125398 type:complete len:81 (-) Transcript_48348:339-581(-)